MKISGNPELKKRIIMTVAGVVVSGIAVGLFGKSGAGFDPFQVFSHGGWMVTEKFIPDISFGTFYTALNLIMLAVIFFTNRRKIGLGTVINIFLVGYLADISEGLLDRILPEPTLLIRGCLLIVAVITLCFASSVYFVADMGVSTYDAVALTVNEKTGIPFRWCRIASDLICVILGFLAGAPVGIGTVITAFFMGPLVDFFSDRVAKPMRYGRNVETPKESKNINQTKVTN